LQLPEPKSENLEFGNSVHSAIDKILKLGKIPNEKETKEIVKNDKEVMRIISKWIKNRLPKISSNRENEKTISIKTEEFPHLNIYGKIDLIEELSHNEVRVTDFKTGNPRKKTDIEKIDEEGRMSDYMRQLAMYSYLLGEKRKQKINVRESVLEFLEAKNDKESFYSTKIDTGQIKLLVRDIKDYDNLVKTGKWINRPCNFKSYGNSYSECEYCKMWDDINR
jgi:RecB family exonuclease